MPNRTARQRQLDALYPTVVRYLGVLVVVFYAIGRSLHLDVPDAVLIAAAGMIGFKTVKGNGAPTAPGGAGNGGT